MTTINQHAPPGSALGVQPAVATGRAASDAHPRVPFATRIDRNALAERALLVARRTALGVLGDHAAADDVAQEVAITALRRIDDLRDPAALDAWIHRIATRRALKEARRVARRRAAEQRQANEFTHDPSERITVEGLGDALAMLGGLPPRQRAALTLRYVHDLDDSQIATALGCRAGTVRSLLSRGRDALRSNLDRADARAVDQHLPGDSSC
jgi:RNA polymerase sigma-70 factor (ECF subfamily)